MTIETDIKYHAGELDKKEREISDKLYSPMYIKTANIWTVTLIAGSFLVAVCAKILKLFGL